MKEVYVLEFDNGQDYEQNDREVFVVCDSYEKVLTTIQPLGFEPFEGSEAVFIRHHENVAGECIEHSDYVFVHTIPFNELKPDIEHVTHHYKKRITKGNPYNVLADNQFVKVSCSHCGSYNFNLDKRYKGIYSFTCNHCSKENYPHTWLERNIVKNPNHQENTLMYYDK